ncbi:MAG: spore maturation protein [Flavobacterium sp.]|nr:MAG: spore maturation protein [Flavobacterium sp.]
MALSRIWSGFIIVAILVATFRLISSQGETGIYSRLVIGKQGDTSQTKVLDSILLSPVIIKTISEKTSYKEGEINYKKNEDNQYISYREQSSDGVIQTSLNAVTICIGLIGVMALFMGFMSIAEKAGGIRLLSRVIGPFFSKIFPEVPKGHPATGHMVMNFSANLLGLDNAATPFGIKAMESLQELNPNKAVASNAQIMFLCLHASGLTLIPVSIIAIRATLKSANPTEIFIPCLIATFVATIAAMIIVSIKQKINLFQPVILAWVGGLSAIIAAMVLYLVTLNISGLQSFSGLLSNGLMLLIFFSIILGGLYKRIDIFDAFVEGAKGGFETAIKIIPYLVGMLIAISLLRTSGTFDIVINGFKSIFAAIGADTRFIDGIPTALIKPLSGSGARGMMIDTMTTHGADSFAGRLAAILQGSSDTTFYVIAVYFGAVNVKNSRYTVWCMLLADFIGICTAIGLAYLFFGSSL